MARRASGPWSRLRYRFDNLMVHGTPVLIGWLTLVCLVIVVPASVVLVWADRGAPSGFSGRATAVWQSVGRTLRLGGEVGPPVYVAMSVLLALVALLFVSALVSLITTGLNERLLALRLGRSVVLEERHTVLLGWSDQVFPVVAELVAANANQRRAAVAVLADEDKAHMDGEIATHVGDTGTTRVICRSGATTDPAVLPRVSPGTAKAVLVLSPGGPDGDRHVVKTLLALDAAVPRAEDRVVVAAVREPRHHTAAVLAAGPHGHVLSIDDIVARLLVQTSRQPGLSLVYRELLDFAGDEFYLVPAAGLAGRTFGEALSAFATTSVAGLVRAGGDTVLSPPPDVRIGAGDRLVVITEDDDTAVPADTVPPVDEDAIVAAGPRAPAAERLLLLGWNRRAPLIVEQLDQYVRPGSSLDVVSLSDAATLRSAVSAVGGCVRLLVTFHHGDITERRTLSGLDVPSYDSVMLIADDGGSAQAGPETDDRTLVTLLHLRAVEEAAGRELSVITEMTDDRNRLLAPVRQGADFIVSGRLISLLMTQIAENRHLAGVFDELFSATGSSIHLRPAADYVLPGRDVSFATVVESARRRQECAIGYRLRAEAATGPSHGVRINPDKRVPVRFGTGDAVIVVAEG
ncbi:CASTOR/POLLUX-related putative ion channel [Streptomyces ficellus]|uniref:NAD-binding lipoprotein n=1 Tax=Streptomyces ficellus TaxID=1977088 RepID=A0A6I6F342_9ACTN|nr:NAD-binding lipoprotein [Streptomyces ficellus]QGV77211.1 NAD-binding lipoprotein [Streptomyces ficellus]